MKYFECQYCLKKYVREPAFKKHECEEMRRNKIAHTPHGITAYEDYIIWLQFKHYRNYGKEHFLESKYFSSFVKFAAFAAKFALPSKKKYIEYMVDLDLSPRDWSNPLVYEEYIKNYEKLLTPEEQAAVSVDTIFELARIFECETNEVFIYLEPGSLIQIIQAKKLSPWLFLFSNKFLWFVKNELTREQRIIIGKFIDYNKWGVIFDREPDSVVKMKAYVKLLGI